MPLLRKCHSTVVGSIGAFWILGAWPVFAAFVELPQYRHGSTEQGTYPSGLTMMRSGEVKPLGWIREQMRGDLNEGYVGSFDKIGEMAAQNIFGKNKADYENPLPKFAARTWWSGEVEAHWMDAVTRIAFLIDDETYQNMARRWVNNVLAHQGKDGYIGEQYMIPFFAACATGQQRYRQAADNALEKLRFHLTPGGSLPSVESVHGKRGTADSLREYCTTNEFLRSLNRVVIKDGKLASVIRSSGGNRLDLRISGDGVILEGSIQPKSYATCTVYIPGWDVGEDGYAQFNRSPQALLKHTEAYWNDIKAVIRSNFNEIPGGLDSENLSFWEHPCATAAWNKTHTTGRMVAQSRQMFVMEKGNQLWLAPFVPNHYMKDSQTVSVRNAPTHFGRTNYTIASSVNDGFIEALIDPPTRNAPDEIIIRVRHPEGRLMRSVLVNAEPHADYQSLEQPQMSVFALLMLGIGAGVLTGLMGVGGGILFLPALMYLVGQRAAKAAGTSLMIVWISSLAAAVLNTKHGNIDVGLWAAMTVGGATGAFIGTRLGLKADDARLRVYFLCVVLGALVLQ